MDLALTLAFISTLLLSLMFTASAHKVNNSFREEIAELEEGTTEYILRKGSFWIANSFRWLANIAVFSISYLLYLRWYNG